MSTKSSAQQGRRTPLSLTGTTSKQQQQQQQQQQSQKISSNLNDLQNNSKSDKTVPMSQKAEKVTTEIKEKKQENVEKKQQHVSKIPTSSTIGIIKKSERIEDKKAENGVGNSNGTVKEKHAYSKDAKVNAKDNRDKKEILGKESQRDLNKDNSEKLEKDLSSKSEEIEKLNVNADKKATKDYGENEKDSAKLIDDKGKETDKKEKKQPEKLEREMKVKRGSAENNEKKNQEKQQKDNIEKMEESVSENKSYSPITKPELTISTKQSEKSPSTKSTPSKATKNTTPGTPTAKSKTANEDFEMEPLTAEEITPTKALKSVKEYLATQSVANQPTATSTPGKYLKRKEIPSTEQPNSEVRPIPIKKGPLPDRNSCPRNFSQISGRRSIRGNDYAPSFVQSNFQYRESYRRINTELDVSSTTNTSLNVTVGSEVPNNLSFSFFGRGRKRDHTPPMNSQSAMDLQNDLELSPKSPKRARIDMYGFLTAVSSPLSLLRARFSKTSIQSSTPVKLHPKSAETVEDDVEVQNVSGISIEEEIPSAGIVGEDVTATEQETEENSNEGTSKQNTSAAVEVNGSTVDVENTEALEDAPTPEKCGVEKSVERIEQDLDDIKVTETLTGGDHLGKNKRCNVM